MISHLKHHLLLAFLLLSSVPFAFGSLSFSLDNVSGDSATQVVVSVRTNDFDSMATIQGSIQFNPALAAFVQAEAFGLTGMSGASFGTTQSATGKITFSWFDPNAGNTGGISVADGSVIFAIRFNLIGSPGQQDSIRFTGVPTPLEFSYFNFSLINPVLTNGSILILQQIPDCLGIPGGTALPATACNDGNPNTGNDVYQQDCSCAGVCNLTALDCNDNCAFTLDSVDAVNCVCLNILSTPNCDDSDCNTADSYNIGTCQCENTPIAPPNCDDQNCATIDSYNSSTCQCEYVAAPVIISQFNISMCDGDSVYIEDTFQTQTGIYYDTLTAANGCDSIIQTNLAVIPTSLTTIDTLLCAGDSIFAGGAYQNSLGVYYDTLLQNMGCDSLVITIIMIDTACIPTKVPNLSSMEDVYSLKIFPNPFSNFTNIMFTISNEENVSFSIYDLLGKEIWHLEADFPIGNHVVEWEGENKEGIQLSPGLYHIRLKADNETRGVKVAVVR